MDAMQVERDFGIPSPSTRLFAALRRRDNPDTEPYNPVTPFQVSVGRDRFEELAAEVGDIPAMIVLLMRGSRIEVLATVLDMDVEEFARQIRAYVKTQACEMLEPIAQRTIRLWQYA